MMRPMKRLEIVVDQLHLPEVLERLREAGVSGYTLVPNVAGYGDRGDQHADDVSGVSSNTLLLIAVDIETAESVLPELRSILRSYGGICLVSDCQWLEH
ncbi:MAG: DUF190 domain-containing protein [Phycisphaeraceae bacterium]|nr:DUF190 domain-containing protein [Phycisphaeraceae bacterium]